MKLFKLNASNYYTHTSLNDARNMGLKIEMIQDDKPNLIHFALFALSLVFQSEWDIAVFFLGAYTTVLHVCVPGMSPIHASIFLDASCTHGNSNTIWGRPRKQYKSDIKRLLSIDAES